MDYLAEQPKRRNMNVRFETWNVSSLEPLSKELSKYRFELVGVQQADGRAVEPNQRKNTRFSVEKGMRIMN
jgi:hypothetical protein